MVNSDLNKDLESVRSKINLNRTHHKPLKFQTLTKQSPRAAGFPLLNTTTYTSRNKHQDPLREDSVSDKKVDSLMHT